MHSTILLPSSMLRVSLGYSLQTSSDATAPSMIQSTRMLVS
jgi:hypothetical protein